MSGLIRWAAVVMSASIVAGCATMTVSSHVQRDLDFGRYRTFDWGPTDALPTGDPRLDADPFFKDHLQGAVERRLAAKGLALAASEPPDLLIHYHAHVSRRIDVNSVDRAYGYCDGDNCPGVSDYEAGTLVLDIIDARTNLLIWRGWARDSVERVIGNEDRTERMINDAVTRMLLRLPPRL